MKKILVLGSAGQIGSRLTQVLTTEGFEVVEFDNYNDTTEDLRIENGKYLDLIANSDFVFFLAFDVGGSRYLENYQNTFEFIQNNIQLMKNTFSALKKFNKPFIFTSSQMSNMNFSTYGVLKLVGEKYTESLTQGKFVKFWNVYGYESVEEKFHVITDFIKMALRNKKIAMRTDGRELRDFLYMDDCCQALISIMRNFEKIPKSAPLDIASHSYISIFEIAEIIAHNLEAEVIPGTKVDQVQLDSQNSPDPYLLNFWTPKTSIKFGIEKIIELEKANE